MSECLRKLISKLAKALTKYMEKYCKFYNNYTKLRNACFAISYFTILLIAVLKVILSKLIYIIF